MHIIGCVGVSYWLNCYLLENYRLCWCNVMIVILILANYRLRRCNVSTELLFLENYRLCRCNILIVILMLVKCRLCRCRVLVEMLLFASYRLSRCRFVTGMLLLIDYRPCSLLRSYRNVIAWKFQLCQCNALTSVCYYYSSLTFEVEEMWCTDSTETSGWVSVE